MTDRQPDPAQGLEPERGFIVAVLGSDDDYDEELGEFRELSRTAEELKQSVSRFKIA